MQGDLAKLKFPADTYPIDSLPSMDIEQLAAELKGQRGKPEVSISSSFKITVSLAQQHLALQKAHSNLRAHAFFSMLHITH